MVIFYTIRRDTTLWRHLPVATKLLRIFRDKDDRTEDFLFLRRAGILPDKSYTSRLDLYYTQTNNNNNNNNNEYSINSLTFYLDKLKPLT